MALDEDERFDALMERCAVIEAQTNSATYSNCPSHQST